jgi:signal transduction histidine kinase
MRELVDQVLTTARFPTVELRMERLAVRDVVAEAVEEIAPKHAVVQFKDGCDGLGDGSPEDLFQPYVQRGTDRSGLGLGLAIVKQAVDVHRGSIEVTNTPGSGCVFAIRLPAASVSRP